MIKNLSFGFGIFGKVLRDYLALLETNMRMLNAQRLEVLVVCCDWMNWRIEFFLQDGLEFMLGFVVVMFDITLER